MQNAQGRDESGAVHQALLSSVSWSSPLVCIVHIVHFTASVVPAHHHVYVVYLRNPKSDGRAGYYVGMTGLTPEERFANHKKGIKSRRRGQALR